MLPLNILSALVAPLVFLSRQTSPLQLRADEFAAGKVNDTLSHGPCSGNSALSAAVQTGRAMIQSLHERDGEAFTTQMPEAPLNCNPGNVWGCMNPTHLLPLI